MITDQHLINIAQILGQHLHQRNWRLATAESCTGGWVAKAITDVPGSSAWLECGFVTYSNAAKQDLLGVSSEVIAKHGAVSEPVVMLMAKGTLTRSRANVAIAVSGIAGPDGGTPDKPVGTVWFAWALPGPQLHTSCKYFPGDREAVRRQAVQQAIEELITILNSD